MVAPEVMLTFLVGVLVRFAIPIALTIVAVWVFRKLDQRWKAEAEELTRLQMSLAMAKRTPCWEQKQCSPEQMASCPAYAQKSVPCWQVMRDKQGNLKSTCVSCSVFLNAPATIEI